MFEGFRPRDVLLALLSTFFFSTSFPLLKYALGYLPPIFFAAVRAVFTAAFFVALFALIKRRMGVPRGRALTASLLVSLFSATYPSLAQNLGILMLDPHSAATISSVFQSTTPLFITILAVFFLSEPLTRGKALGAIISFTGVLLLTLEGKDLSALKSATTLGGLLILSTALSYSISSIIIKKTLDFYSRLDLLAWSSLFSALTYLPIVGLVWFFGVETPAPERVLLPPVLLSLLFLSLVVGGAVMVIWYRLIDFYPVSRLTYFSYLIPIFAGLISIIFMGERLSTFSLIYIALVLLGIYIVQRPEGRGAIRVNSLCSINPRSKAG